MQKKCFIILLACLFLVFNLSYITASSIQSNQNKELEDVLSNSSQYCSKLAHAVLDFVCKEKVVIDFFTLGESGTLSRIEVQSRGRQQEIGVESWRKQRKFKTQKLVYDYQLVSKEFKLSEQRILLEVDGKKASNESNDIERRFPHSLLILGPIGLLSEYWQKRHDYKIKKKGRLFGEKTYVIEAVPKPEYATEHLWGKVWISQDDFSILKIEWNQESAKGYESLIQKAKQQNLQPDFSLIAEYEYEKNGIRFPSKFVLKENYKHPKYKLIKNSKKTVVYFDYKFFTVKTDVVVK
ncbi:MAG: hypothetical protein GF421_07625 [Candidatus Aminicenantes bacterium]|nr:hypothetical protein [Candidatus Aminicenantes bacterium]